MTEQEGNVSGKQNEDCPLTSSYASTDNTKDGVPVSGERRSNESEPSPGLKWRREISFSEEGSLSRQSSTTASPCTTRSGSRMSVNSLSSLSTDVSRTHRDSVSSLDDYHSPNAIRKYESLSDDAFSISSIDGENGSHIHAGNGVAESPATKKKSKSLFSKANKFFKSPTKSRSSSSKIDKSKKLSIPEEDGRDLTSGISDNAIGEEAKNVLVGPHPSPKTSKLAKRLSSSDKSILSLGNDPSVHGTKKERKSLLGKNIKSFSLKKKKEKKKKDGQNIDSDTSSQTVDDKNDNDEEYDVISTHSAQSRSELMSPGGIGLGENKAAKHVTNTTHSHTVEEHDHFTPGNGTDETTTTGSNVRNDQKSTSLYDQGLTSGIYDNTSRVEEKKNLVGPQPSPKTSKLTKRLSSSSDTSKSMLSLGEDPSKDGTKKKSKSLLGKKLKRFSLKKKKEKGKNDEQGFDSETSLPTVGDKNDNGEEYDNISTQSVQSRSELMLPVGIGLEENEEIKHVTNTIYSHPVEDHDHSIPGNGTGEATTTGSNVRNDRKSTSLYGQDLESGINGNANRKKEKNNLVGPQPSPKTSTLTKRLSSSSDTSKSMLSLGEDPSKEGTKKKSKSLFGKKIKRFSLKKKKEKGKKDEQSLDSDTSLQTVDDKSDNGEEYDVISTPKTPLRMSSNTDIGLDVKEDTKQGTDTVYLHPVEEHGRSSSEKGTEENTVTNINVPNEQKSTTLYGDSNDESKNNTVKVKDEVLKFEKMLSGDDQSNTRTNTNINSPCISVSEDGANEYDVTETEGDQVSATSDNRLGSSNVDILIKNSSKQEESVGNVITTSIDQVDRLHPRSIAIDDSTSFEGQEKESISHSVSHLHPRSPNNNKSPKQANLVHLSEPPIMGDDMINYDQWFNGSTQKISSRRITEDLTDCMRPINEEVLEASCLMEEDMMQEVESVSPSGRPPLQNESTEKSLDTCGDTLSLNGAQTNNSPQEVTTAKTLLTGAQTNNFQQDVTTAKPSVTGPQTKVSPQEVTAAKPSVTGTQSKIPIKKEVTPAKPSLTGAQTKVAPDEVTAAKPSVIGTQAKIPIKKDVTTAKPSLTGAQTKVSPKEVTAAKPSLTGAQTKVSPQEVTAAMPSSNGAQTKVSPQQVTAAKPSSNGAQTKVSPQEVTAAKPSLTTAQTKVLPHDVTAAKPSATEAPAKVSPHNIKAAKPLSKDIPFVNPLNLVKLVKLEREVQKTYPKDGKSEVSNTHIEDFMDGRTNFKDENTNEHPPGITIVDTGSSNVNTTSLGDDNMSVPFDIVQTTLKLGEGTDTYNEDTRKEKLTIKGKSFGKLDSSVDFVEMNLEVRDSIEGKEISSSDANIKPETNRNNINEDKSKKIVEEEEHIPVDEQLPLEVIPVSIKSTSAERSTDNKVHANIEYYNESRVESEDEAFDMLPELILTQASIEGTELDRIVQRPNENLSRPDDKVNMKPMLEGMGTHNKDLMDRKTACANEKDTSERISTSHVIEPIAEKENSNLDENITLGTKIKNMNENKLEQVPIDEELVSIDEQLSLEATPEVTECTNNEESMYSKVHTNINSESRGESEDEAFDMLPELTQSQESIQGIESDSGIENMDCSTNLDVITIEDEEDDVDVDSVTSLCYDIFFDTMCSIATDSDYHKWVGNIKHLLCDAEVVAKLYIRLATKYAQYSSANEVEMQLQHLHSAQIAYDVMKDSNLADFGTVITYLLTYLGAIKSEEPLPENICVPNLLSFLEEIIKRNTMSSNHVTMFTCFISRPNRTLTEHHELRLRFLHTCFEQEISQLNLHTDEQSYLRTCFIKISEYFMHVDMQLANNLITKYILPHITDENSTTFIMDALTYMGLVKSDVPYVVSTSDITSALLLLDIIFLSNKMSLLTSQKLYAFLQLNNPRFRFCALEREALTETLRKTIDF